MKGDRREPGVAVSVVTVDGRPALRFRSYRGEVRKRTDGEHLELIVFENPDQAIQVGERLIDLATRDPGSPGVDVSGAADLDAVFAGCCGEGEACDLAPDPGAKS